MQSVLLTIWENFESLKNVSKKWSGELIFLFSESAIQFFRKSKKELSGSQTIFGASRVPRSRGGGGPGGHVPPNFFRIIKS